MIDIARMERFAASTEGDLIALSKDQFAEIMREMKRLRGIARDSVRHIAFGDVCASIAAGAPA